MAAGWDDPDLEGEAVDELLDPFAQITEGLQSLGLGQGWPLDPAGELAEGILERVGVEAELVLASGYFFPKNLRNKGNRAFACCGPHAGGRVGPHALLGPVPYSTRPRSGLDLADSELSLRRTLGAGVAGKAWGLPT